MSGPGPDLNVVKPIIDQLIERKCLNLDRSEWTDKLLICVRQINSSEGPFLKHKCLL